MKKLSFKRDPEVARRNEYPPIGDQLDALVKGFDALSKLGVELPPETQAWIDQCLEIKSKYPKE